MISTPDDNYEELWSIAAKKLVWRKPWHTVFSGNFANCKWFEGGELNVTETCVDQHALGERASKTAIRWESEGGETEQLSYKDLLEQVCELAAGLRALGAKKGDRIAIYMPLCPKAIVAMLACARIGATHTVVFAGFSAQSLSERIDDSGCRLVITADGFKRKGQVIKLKDVVDEALSYCEKNTVQHVVILNRQNLKYVAATPKDIDWDDCIKLGKEQSLSGEPQIVDAEHPLFILYTSGTTGTPKGIVHTCGGYLTQVRSTCESVLDMKDTDVYWCTADIGWITGHSYLVYGPLALGATLFIYEGALTSPAPDQLFKLIDKYQISILYTSPTAIRMFMQQGINPSEKHSLDSLRLLGTVGEPINPEAWMWWNKCVGKEQCPNVDTWWQTETGAIMISPIPGKVMTKAGSATYALCGIDAQIVDANGNQAAPEENGYLVINKPWPSIARGIYGDQKRFVDTYFSRFANRYFTGDGAKQDSDGYFWILGRVDDVVNVAGHRLGTAEIESELITHSDVAESAVVSRNDTITGQAIVAFVTLKKDTPVTAALREAISQCVVKEIGAFAKPQEIIFTAALPKTRSGKIMRRVLRQIASGDAITGDLSTLEDLESLKALVAHNDQNTDSKSL